VAFKITVNKTIRIKTNGAEYESPDQVPPELRAEYDKAAQTGASFSLRYKPPTAGELLPDVPQKVQDTMGSAPTPLRVPAWLWVVVLAGLASLLLYLYQNGR
jgi:hypothetical protein